MASPRSSRQQQPAGLAMSGTQKLLVFSVCLNVGLLAGHIVRGPLPTGDGDASAEPAAAATTMTEPAATAPGPDAPADELTQTPVATATVESAPEPEPAGEPVEAPSPPVVIADDARVSVATIERNIPHALAQLMDEAQANVLAQTLTRALVWNVLPHRDLRRGDELRVLWSPEGEGARVHALHFESERYGRTFEAYAWQASDSRWPSYYDEEGTEVPLTLRHCPLADYEQITSLLDDRPDHQGMDFMAPVGTPVLAPFDGTVHAVNWNERFNGQCIELRGADGVSAKFLHLSEVSVSVGAQVSRGQTIGETGNTGRSTGPHLHYELARGEQIIDPLDYHDTFRRELPAVDRPAYQAHIDALRSRLRP